MIINKIEPQGFCKGVINAIKIVKETLEKEKNIYLLGEIIHNKNVINELTNLGAITIPTEGKTRLELLDEIESGTVIFSAHGVSPKVYEKARMKSLKIIDATCPMVLLVHNNIIKKINEGYDVIYIGTKNHPEVEGVLGISSSINFVSSINDIENLNINNNKIYATNQTTLSKYDIENIYEQLKNKYPNILIDNKICNATTIRQEAIKNQPKADLCIIVGDKLSSNTKKLVKVSETIAKIKTIQCEDLSSLNMDDLKNVNVVNISSGASTPDYIVDEIIDYLKKK
ncbi:MAG: 4-hydroxy-3-methylbut-2-enyl diphosphate reductase [Acholeplasmatales bacterium]|nr:4-hydroxy-3-methylbut-2-enyl diphosphate reductase [Acholeplasmatales bacterium]